VNFQDTKLFLFSGIPGAFLGIIMLKKINQNILKNIFGVFSIWTGIKLIIK